VTENAIRIDKRVFRRLLAIKAIDGSLFHQQGKFPAHGLAKLNRQTGVNFVLKEVLESVDFDNSRLLIHLDGILTRNCTEEDLEKSKWASARRRKADGWLL
jgi:hypothetical protein